MPWGALAGAAVSAIGSGLSASTQASAAQQAAQDQENASLAQLGLSADVFNAQSTMQQPTREVGGLAQSREAYLLGLDPNLDISQDFESPQVSFNPSAVGSGSNPSSLYYVNSSGQTVSGSPTSTGTQATGSSAYGPTGPVSFGGQTYGYAYPTGASAPSAGSFSLAGGGYSQPVSTLGATAAPTAAATGGASTGASSSIPNPNASLPAGSYGSFSSPYNPSTFYEDPGYQFELAQGQQAITNQQATTGLALSPSSLAAALNYNQGMASQEFNNAYNRSMNTQTTQLNELNALSSGGQIATSGVSSAASGLGTAGSSALAGYGNAASAGAVGVGNAYSSGINGATNAALYGVNSPYGASAFNSGFGSNPQNLGGSTPVAPAGSSLTYDADGNITGSTPD